MIDFWMIIDLMLCHFIFGRNDFFLSVLDINPQTDVKHYFSEFVTFRIKSEPSWWDLTQRSMDVGCTWMSNCGSSKWTRLGPSQKFFFRPLFRGDWSRWSWIFSRKPLARGRGLPGWALARREPGPWSWKRRTHPLRVAIWSASLWLSPVAC